MKAFKCIICRRDKQGAVICHPCRLATNRLIENNIDPLEVFIIMMWPNHRITFGRRKI